jgi:hypothetical protein
VANEELIMLDISANTTITLPVKLQQDKSNLVMSSPRSPMFCGKVKPVFPLKYTSQPLHFMRMTDNGNSPVQ